MKCQYCGKNIKLGDEWKRHSNDCEWKKSIINASKKRPVPVVEKKSGKKSKGSK